MRCATMASLRGIEISMFGGRQRKNGAKEGEDGLKMVLKRQRDAPVSLSHPSQQTRRSSPVLARFNDPSSLSSSRCGL
jgi:hypothetical protein